MDSTLSQILTYLFATLQENARLEKELAVLKSGLPIHTIEEVRGEQTAD